MAISIAVKLAVSRVKDVLIAHSPGKRLAYTGVVATAETRNAILLLSSIASPNRIRHRRMEADGAFARPGPRPSQACFYRDPGLCSCSFRASIGIGSAPFWPQLPRELLWSIHMPGKNTDGSRNRQASIVTPRIRRVSIAIKFPPDLQIISSRWRRIIPCAAPCLIAISALPPRNIIFDAPHPPYNPVRL